MPELSRHPQRPATTGGGHKPRLLVLRERIRSLPSPSGAGPAALRLSVAVSTVAGSVLAIWMLGYLGFRLGVAPLLGVPELLAEPGQGLATGVLLLLRSPLTIFGAGLAAPFWLVAAFAAIALPAAALPAARPSVPGGPRPSNVAAGFSAAAATLAMCFAAAVLAWVVLPWRLDHLAPLPSARVDLATWASGLSTIAGLDLLIAVTAVLWVVLVVRLAIPSWLRWLAGAAACFALAVVLVAAAISNAAAVHARLDRSVVRQEGGEALLLGYTREHVALLRMEGDRPAIELVPSLTALPIVGRASVADGDWGTGRDQDDERPVEAPEE